MKKRWIPLLLGTQVLLVAGKLLWPEALPSWGWTLTPLWALLVMFQISFAGLLIFIWHTETMKPRMPDQCQPDSRDLEEEESVMGRLVIWGVLLAAIGLAIILLLYLSARNLDLV